MAMPWKLIGFVGLVLAIGGASHHHDGAAPPFPHQETAKGAQAPAELPLHELLDGCRQVAQQSIVNAETFSESRWDENYSPRRVFIYFDAANRYGMIGHFVATCDEHAGQVEGIVTPA